jgi:hypothetical protein
MSSSQANCHRFTNLSSMGRSRTTVADKSLTRHENPASVNFCLKYLAVSIQ